MKKILAFPLFGLLYFVQGAIMSFFTALNSIYLLSFDISMSKIGLLGMIAMIPFVLKIFIGIISDKYNLLNFGYRKPYIALGLILQAVCLFVVIFINPGKQFWLYVLIALLLMVGMAFYDTATDGLALDTTKKDDEGTIQGIMVGGRALGVVIVSATIGVIVQKSNWEMAFLFLACVTLLPLLLVFLIREPLKEVQNRFEWKAFQKFKSWPIIALGLLGALYSLIINGTNQIINPFYQKVFNLGPEKLGFMTMFWGFGVVIGGLAGGIFTDKLGQKRSLFIAMVISIVSIMLLPFAGKIFFAIAFVVLFGLAFGYYETVYFAISMQKSDSRIAASMFSILMAVANVGTGVGLVMSGSLVDLVNYKFTFITFALINILALPLISNIFNRRKSIPAQLISD